MRDGSSIAALRPENGLPCSVEGEQQALGCALLNPDRVSAIAGRGGADLFHDPVHAAIFEAMVAKDRSGHLVSPVTIGETLKGHEGLRELGGPPYLARLAGASVGVSSLPGYLDMLADLRNKRGLVAVISQAQAAIARGDESAGQIAGRIEAGLVALSPADGGGPVSMLKAVSAAMDQIRAAYHGDEVSVVRTGIADLDRMISGFYPGELILLGGRPSMGKTGVALSIALNAARAGHGVCIASLEMNPEAMAMRALSEQTAQQHHAVSYSQMRRGEMAESQVNSLRDAARFVAELPISFLPRDHADLGALFAGAKRVKRAMPDMRLMVVDYAQLLRTDARSRYEQITEISIALKALAGQLNVPVLALSQLSREVEKRDDKRPMLSDLRESGQLEQDADAVLFCYRDEYYVERMRPEEDDLDALAEWQQAMDKSRNRLEIIVAKQRQGEIGTARCRFNPALNLVWEDGH